jgi:hypothetical protein
MTEFMTPAVRFHHFRFGTKNFKRLIFVAQTVPSALTICNAAFVFMGFV